MIPSHHLDLLQVHLEKIQAILEEVQSIADPLIIGNLHLEEVQIIENMKHQLTFTNQPTDLNSLTNPFITPVLAPPYLMIPAFLL